MNQKEKVFLVFFFVFIFPVVSVSVDEKNALEELYSTTNGEEWFQNDGWMEGDPCLPPWFGLLCSSSSVVSMVLSANNLDGSLEESLSDLENLQTLRLNGNLIFGEIPTTLAQIPSLHTLNLESNPLFGEVPTEFGQFSSLEYLYLGETAIEGTLPTELGNISSLIELELAVTLVAGPIPPELASLSNLLLLSLSTNYLEGSIPPQFGRMEKLQDLYLDTNFLTGGIPPELGDLENLETLVLHSNSIGGDIPPQIGELSELNILSLSHNLLEGPIPTQIGETDLSELYLNGNNLEGSIPREIGNLKKMTIMLLSDNFLDSSIPTEIGELSDLQEINFSENCLEGTIPTEITGLSNLTYLDLQQNSLTGEIPSDPGLLDLDDLTLLLNKNLLWGNVPDWVLEVPVKNLRYNYLTDCDSSCLLSSVCVDPFDELGTEYEAPDSDLGINVTWLEKQASFLGTELVLLELEVNFPSELFGINSIVCRNFGECVPVTQSSNPRNDPSCGTLTEVFVNTTKFVDDSTRNSFQPFYVEIEDSCESISISVVPISGEPDLYVSYNEPICLFEDASIVSATEGRDQIIICATDERESLIFFSVFSSNSVTSYEIQIESLKLPKLPTGKGKGSSNQLEFEAVDGVEQVIFNRGVEMFFVADTIFPFSCFLHVEVSHSTVITVFINESTYTSPATNDPDTRSFIDISVCSPGQNETNVGPIDMVISLYAEFSVNVSFLFTTDPYVTRPPIDTLYLLDAVKRLSQSNCINITTTCGSLDFWKATSANGFNPPRLSMFPDLYSDIFLDEEWVYPDYFSVSPTSIYVYLLFEQSSDIDIVDDIQLSFGACLVDDSGAMVVSPFTLLAPEPKKVVCDHEELTPLLELASDRLTALIDAQFSAERFQQLVELDIIRINTTWSACDRQADSFINQTGSGSLIQEKVDDNCENSDCVTFFFEDYLVNSNLIKEGDCTNDESVPSIQWYLDCKDELFSFDKSKEGRLCKSDQDCFLPAVCANGTCFANGLINCTEDSECVIESSCDYFSSLCIDSQDVSETLMLRCFIDEMSTSVETLLALQFGLVSPDKYSSEYFLTLREQTRTESCISIVKTGMSALRYQVHFVLQIGVQGDDSLDDCACFHEIGDFYPDCLDELCSLPAECQYSVYDDSFAYEPADIALGGCVYYNLLTSLDSTCYSETQCNWNPEIRSLSGENSTDGELCLSGSTEFCGTRIDTTSPFYFEVVLVTAEDCENQESVCVLSTGAILLGPAEKEKCDELGVCSGYCPSEELTCVPENPLLPSVCYREDISEEDCLSGLGFLSFEGFCVYMTRNSPDECRDTDQEKELYVDGAIGEINFTSCSERDIDDCVVDDFSVLTCLAAPIRICLDEEDCEEEGHGKCEDIEFFPFQGICVIPFIEGVDRLFCFVNLTVTNIGCGNPYITQEDCELNSDLGWVYRFPSVNIEDCEAYGYGCLTNKFSQTGILESYYTDPSEYPGTSIEDVENSCQRERGEIMPLFEWEEGVWASGKTVPTTRVPKRELILLNKEADILDFVSLGSIVENSVEIENFSLLQNLALCATSYSLIESLNVTSCSCLPELFEGSWTGGVVLTDSEFGSDIDSDFGFECVDNCTASFRVVSVTRVCPEIPQFVQTANANFGFSVDAECMNVRVAEAPYQTFADPVVVPVALSFIPTKGSNAKNSYSIVENNKGEVVGQIMSDVFFFNKTFEEFVKAPFPEGHMDLVLLCLSCVNEEAIDQAFEVWDLGTPKDEDDEDDEDIFIPLGLTGSPLGNSLVAFEGVGLVDQRTDYVLILRMRDYKTFSVVTDAERAVLITSCAVFGFAAALVGVMYIAYYVMFKTLEVFTIVVQCFIMLSIRSVYFAILVEEVIDTGSLIDYILIEIPTFFFLQVLIQILVAVTFVQRRIKSGVQESKKEMWKITLLLWFLVWLGFAVVVIAISQVDSSTKLDSQCDCRLTEATRGSDETRTIRIVYKSVISLLSLVVLFLIGRMGWNSGAERSEVIKQIMLVSFFLVLDCLAFVIYYAIDKPSPYFSIVLWFTEVLPLVILCSLLCKPGVILAVSSFMSVSRTSMSSLRTSRKGTSTTTSTVED